MNDGSMFTELRKYLDVTFAGEHNEIDLYTTDKVYIYNVFSVSKTDVYSDCFNMSFANEDDYKEWLSSQTSRSAIDFGLLPNSDDRVITLSTCVGNGETLNRYVVQAVLTDIIDR